MKTQIISFALSSLVSVGLLAALPLTQDQSAPPEANQATQTPRRPADPQRQVKMLSRRLALSNDQQTQILAIVKDRQERVAAITSDGSLSEKDRRASLKTVHSESTAKIRALLNDNQQTEFDQIQQEARERARTRHETRTKVAGSDAAPNK